MLANMLHDHPQATRFMSLWILAVLAFTAIGFVSVYADGLSVTLGPYALKTLAFTGLAAVGMTLMREWKDRIVLSRFGSIRMGILGGTFVGVLLTGYYWLDFFNQGASVLISQIDFIVTLSLILMVVGALVAKIEKQKLPD